MADLAIGISKTVVEALVKKVKSAIKEDTELWESLQRDVVFIHEEFEMMQSFLDSADGERMKNNIGRTWVGQVRDLSYDTEDCMDFIVHMDTKRPLWSVLRHLVVASCTCKSGAVSPLDEVAAEIRVLKARVEDVSRRKMRYGLLNDVTAAEQLASVSASGAPAVDILTEARVTAKNLGGSVDLTRLVTEKTKELRVISVWGSGDHGASVIKEAYDKPEVCDMFSRRAWLKLAHPFNPHEFLRNLADHLQIEFSTKYIDALKNVLLLHILEERYLVVLEGLSSMGEWHAVQAYLPERGNGSRIVVSTEQVEIARLCVGRPYHVLQIRNQSVCVFFHKVCSRHISKIIVVYYEQLQIENY